MATILVSFPSHLQLLEHAYPGLLNSEFSGQLVEIFAPVPFVFEEEENNEVLCEGDAKVVGREGIVGEGEGERERWRGGEQGGEGEGKEERVRGGVKSKEGEDSGMVGRNKRETGRTGGSEREGSECNDIEKDGVAGVEEDSVFTFDPTLIQVQHMLRLNH